MPVELRKRKAREPVPEPARPQKKTSKVAKAAAKVKEAITGKKAAAASEDANGAAPAPAKAATPVKGDVINLDGFGGEIQTQDGTKTTLKALVEQSKAGVVLFTYPKASTPGCTKQACFFRDSYEPLTAGGLAIYGLSNDSPKANTTFKEKYNLPYPLLCDPSAILIAAIGLKKAPKSTQRGVFVVDKAGKVLAAEPGSPAGTVEVVKKLVEAGGAPEAAAEAKTTADPVPDAAAPAADAAPASVEAPKVEEPVVEKKE